MKILLSQKQLILLRTVQALFNKKIYLVGGAVRDILIGDEPKDYDFCSELSTLEVKEQLKGKHRAYLIGEKHGTIGFKVDGEMIEITTFRTESYIEGSRQPNVQFVDTIEQDLGRRDFTINAMAIRCDTLKLIDPYGGQEDIKNKLLRTVGNSKTRFKEDPLRILRAVRFASKFNYDIEDKTEDRMGKMSNKLLEISKERWMSELDKILLNDNKDGIEYGLSLMWNNDIFTYIIPELQLQLFYNQNSKYHNYHLHEHTSYVVMATPKDINLRWAALLHDIAKPFVRTDNKKGHCNYINHEILGAEMVEKLTRHLKWSNERRVAVVNLVRNHLKDDCPLRQYDNLGKK